jgi:hypothetical protein
MSFIRQRRCDGVLGRHCTVGSIRLSAAFYLNKPPIPPFPACHQRGHLYYLSIISPDIYFFFKKILFYSKIVEEKQLAHNSLS